MLGDGPGIFPIRPFLFLGLLTAATQSGPFPKKVGNPRVWKPPGLASLKTRCFFVVFRNSGWGFGPLKLERTQAALKPVHVDQDSPCALAWEALISSADDGSLDAAIEHVKSSSFQGLSKEDPRLNCSQFYCQGSRSPRENHTPKVSSAPKNPVP